MFAPSLREPDAGPLRVIDLGRMPYAEAFDVQNAHVERVLAARAAGRPEPGCLLLVEHDPVITVSRRASAGGNVLATPAALAAARVSIEPTDRGGDVTYHGPGQLVAYPILDLNHVGLNLHGHIRMLEQAVIDTLAAFGVVGTRDPGATGVWVGQDAADGTRQARKIAAMGVRVRRWVSLHGLAINVDPDMAHFGLIVPCGLVGRPVTSLRAELARIAPAAPPPEMDAVKRELVSALQRLIAASLGSRQAPQHLDHGPQGLPAV